jgi:hypothetical protein
LGLIALFTQVHIFWIAGLLLAFIELPDFGTPLKRIARSAETIAGIGTGAVNNTRTSERGAEPYLKLCSSAKPHREIYPGVPLV